MLALAIISCILGSFGVILFLAAIELVLKKVIDSYRLRELLTGFLCLFLIGVHIGINIYVGIKFGAPGVAIFNLIGIILGIIGFIKLPKDSSTSSSIDHKGVANYLHQWELENIDKYKNWQG